MDFSPRPRPSAQSISIERLETRLAFAGNVTAYVSRGTLTLRSDDLGADITISQPAPGQITVSGTDTTINRALDSVTFSGVTRNLFIRLGRGRDQLTIDQTGPITIPGNVDIFGGGGSDSIATLMSTDGILRVGGSLRVWNLSSRTDASVTSLRNVDIKGDLRIQTTGQGGMVQIDGSGGTGPASRIGGSVFIVNDARDAAYAGLSTVTVGGCISVTNRGWACSTVMGAVAARKDVSIVSQAARYSSVLVTGTNMGGSLYVDGGAVESAGCLLTACVVQGATTVIGGLGKDSVIFNGTDFRRAVSVFTGFGADRLSVGAESSYTFIRFVPELREDTQFRVHQVLRPVFETQTTSGAPVQFQSTVNAFLGAETDSLVLGAEAVVTFRAWASFDGQGGRNEARVNWANLAHKPRLRAFAVTSL